ncbi:MAG TPA: hypothetical protein VEA38_12420 [Terriglobales bacterium]|nr:hypothetical protein [Terriglobales bacterium]
MRSNDRGGGAGGDALTPPPPNNTWKLPDLRVDRDGEWYDEGVQITHHGVLANLRGNLRRDAEGYFIQTRVRIPVRVEDVPFIVTRVERQGERLQVRVNDGTEETLDPSTLRIGAGDAPYAAVKGGAFEARFDRAAAWQLLQLADYDEASGAGTLRLPGGEWPLRRAS